jgi:hypothetical protein
LVLKGSEDLAQIGPWASSEIDGRITVVVPANLESFADDPMTLLACAALTALNEPTIISLADHGGYKVLDKKSQKNPCQWALGAASFLQYREASPPKARGPWSRGWHWAASWSMEPLKIDSWLLNGRSEHLTHAMTGKAWSQSVDPCYARIEALARAAAKNIRYTPDIQAWKVPYQSLIGTHIKKSFFNEKEGVLSQAEISTLKTAYNAELTAFKQLAADYEAISSEQELKDFPSVISSRTKDLAKLENLYDNIVRSRVRFITPDSVREKKREAKRPMKDRIAEIDPTKEFNLMCISVAVGRGYRPIARGECEVLSDYESRLRADIEVWSARIPAVKPIQDLAANQMISYLL